jgi:hypothetical protein
MSKQPIWHGGVSIGVSIGARSCDECAAPADVRYEIGISARGDRGRWACRACVLDPVRQIGAIDRRGDVLHGPRIARELDAQTAITLHLEANEDRAGLPPLPAPYQHVLAVLDRCRRVDADFSTALTELRDHYRQAAFFSPKQTLLIQWRLAENGTTHDPGCFVVSTRSDKEIGQIRGFDDWRRKKLAPYLSWAQRSRWGF